MPACGVIEAFFRVHGPRQYQPDVLAWFSSVPLTNMDGAARFGVTAGGAWAVGAVPEVVVWATSSTLHTAAVGFGLAHANACTHVVPDGGVKASSFWV